MKKILLMTDFSDNANNAIIYAINIFGENVAYILMNSYIVQSPPRSFDKNEGLAHDKSKKKLLESVTTIKSNFSQYTKLNITTYSKYGAPIEVLDMAAKEHNISFVVMGTKGASGLTKIFLGSITASVVQHTPLPVIAVPDKCKFTSLDKITFAADLHKNRNEDILVPLKQIAKEYNSEIALLNVLKKEDLSAMKENQQIDKLKEPNFLNEFKHSWNFVESDDIGLAISDFCKQNKTDLLVVIARHNKFFDRLFHSSTSQELLFYSKLPILALDDSYTNAERQ